MIDLIVFSVGDNRYAMNIENVQRIIQVESLTNIPNAHPCVDGMMSYEDKVIKVLSFRKVIKMNSYKEELKVLFSSLKLGHEAWVNALRVSLEHGSEFTKTLNPHACALGKWIDSFTAYDDKVVEVLNELIEFHKQLHTTGGIALEVYKSDKTEALRILNEDIQNIYQHTMGAIDTFILELDLVANSLQKLIIYDSNEQLFAIKVDTIEDIAHVDESQFKNSSGDDEMESGLLELSGIIELQNNLVNIIKSVKLPK